jgi:hypothetical protein
MTTLPLDVEKEPQNTQQSAQSSNTKVGTAAEPESDRQTIETPGKVAAEGIDSDDDGYPQGLRLFCIVVALGMSIFLVALDMVRLAIPIKSLLPNNRIDDCSDSYTQNHRSVP